jgi:hypothetical protein
MKRMMIVGALAVLAGLAGQQRASADCRFSMGGSFNICIEKTRPSRCFTFSRVSHPLPCCGPNCCATPAMFDGLHAYGPSGYPAPPVAYAPPAGYPAPALAVPGVPAAPVPYVAPQPTPSTPPKTAGLTGQAGGMQQVGYSYYQQAGYGATGTAPTGYGANYGYGAGYGASGYFQAPSYWYGD